MFRVCTFNVHAWGDRSGRVRIDETIAVLVRTQSDVIVLNEVLSPGGALTRVARALDMHVTYAASGWGGNAVLTRQPDVRAHSVSLSSSGGEPRSVVMVRVESSDFGPVIVAGTHLDHRREAVRVAQLALLFEAVRAWMGDEALCHVIAGDLNAVRTADYPREVLDAIVRMRVSNGHEPSLNDVVHALDREGYVDAARLSQTKDLTKDMTGYRADLSSPTPAPLPEALRTTCWAGTRVDHVWLDARMSERVRAVHATVVDTDVSDHRPVVVELEPLQE